MDALCTKLEALHERLSTSIEAMATIGRLHRNKDDTDNISVTGHETVAYEPCGETLNNADVGFAEETILDGDVMQTAHQAEPIDGDSDLAIGTHESLGKDGVLAGSLLKDSYGFSRFVGGVTNAMLIDTIQELSAENSMTALRAGMATAHDPKRVELPFFLPGRVWPDLPFLPKAEQLPRPPQYVAESLVGLYFDRIHYTFPIVFKPTVLKRYRQAYRGSCSNDASTERRFLMVFFAICACASSLVPSSPDTQLTGNEYYEKALLLYYASAGEASMERVQCLGLLALCTAGWNTLAQSWMYAGQAVRAAIDIGLHLDHGLVSLTNTVDRS